MTEAPQALTVLEAFPARKTIPILIAGLPSQRLTRVVQSLNADPKFQVLSAWLTSKEHGGSEINVGGKRFFLTSDVPYHSLIYHPGTIAVNLDDPTFERLPSLIKAKIPCIVDETDWNKSELLDLVNDSDICVVTIPDDIDPYASVYAAADFLHRIRWTGVTGHVFSMFRTSPEELTDYWRTA